MPGAVRVSSKAEFALAATPNALEEAGLNAAERAVVAPLARRPMPAGQLSRLCGECEASARAGAERRFETFLLWGVTASGETEVYLQLAARCLAEGRQALVMVPEIALTDYLVQSFRARFGAIAAVAHSAQNISERWAAWNAALGGQARILLGPRSALFAPLHNLGLIVVDEEHDPAYKQEEAIRYHARDLAVVPGRHSSCPVVLGSATPSA